MKNLLSSATKIVFLLLTLALIAFVFLGIVDWKDFMAVVSLVFAFYFIKKNDNWTDPFAWKDPM